MFGYVTGFDSCHLGRSHIQLHCCKQMRSLCICKNKDYEGTEHDAMPELEDSVSNINLLSLK